MYREAQRFSIQFKKLSHFKSTRTDELNLHELTPR